MVSEQRSRHIDHIFVPSGWTVEDCHAFLGEVTGNMTRMHHVLVHACLRFPLSKHPKKQPPNRLNFAAVEVPEKGEVLSTATAAQLNTNTCTSTDEIC